MSQYPLRSLNYFLFTLLFLVLSVPYSSTAASSKLPPGIQPRADAYEKYGNPADGSQYLEVEPHHYVHFREHGVKKENSPTLLFVPGTTDNLHNWYRLASLLQPHYHVIRIDTPGFGLSDAASMENFPEAQVERLHNFIKQMQLEKIVVIGNSLGGLISWILAAKQDQLQSKSIQYEISHLILLDPVAFKGSMPVWLDLVDDIGGYIIKKRPHLARKITSSRLGTIISRRLFADHTKIPDVNEIRERSIDLFFTEGNLDSYIDIFNAEGDYRFPHTKLIPKITMPTLVMYGAEDKIVPPKQHKLWRKNLNSVQTKLLPNVGHLPHVEAPEVTSRLIHNFLRQN